PRGLHSSPPRRSSDLRPRPAKSDVALLRLAQHCSPRAGQGYCSRDARSQWNVMNTIRAALTLGIAMSFMASPAQADDWPSQMSRVPVLACDSPEIQGVVRDWLAREPGFEITMQTTRWNTNCS